MNYVDWKKQSFNYDFNNVFTLVSVIYFLSTMFDYCLTFITYRLSPDEFIKHESLFIIKNILNDNALFYIFVIFMFILPLIIIYYVNCYHIKKYGYQVNEIKICYYGIYSICLLHLIGGFTNFLHLINL